MLVGEALSTVIALHGRRDEKLPCSSLHAVLQHELKFYYSTTVLIENFTQIVRIFALSTVLYSTR